MAGLYVFMATAAFLAALAEFWLLGRTALDMAQGVALLVVAAVFYSAAGVIHTLEEGQRVARRLEAKRRALANGRADD